MGKSIRTTDEGVDNFPTPSWATEIIIPYLRTPKTIMEPAVGEGDMLRVLQRRWPRASYITCDIRDVDPPSDYHITGDFLAMPPEPLADLVITNPPYCRNWHAEFAKKCLTHVRPGGQVALLVPTGFAGSARRLRFHLDHPADFYWLPRRPSFTGDGKNGGTEYMWWVYTAGSAAGQTSSRNFFLE